MLAHHHTYCRHHGYRVEHYVLQRVKEYNQSGRNQNEQEAREFDEEIVRMLDTNGIQYKVAPADNPAEWISRDLLKFCVGTTDKLDKGGS
jgi:hypothetical protein